MSTYDYKDITVSGTGLFTIVQSVRAFSVLVETLHEVLDVQTRDKSGALAVDPDGWYPLEKYMAAYKKIETLLGGRGLEKIGMQIPANVIFPPNIHDVHGVLGSVDVAFHMNHKLHGKSMFDPATGAMLEGIGHYHYYPTPGKNEGRMVAANPYPCRFDLGVTRGMAQRFAPQAQATHELTGGCRLKGGESCTYLVSW